MRILPFDWFTSARVIGSFGFPFLLLRLPFYSSNPSDERFRQFFARSSRPRNSLRDSLLHFPPTVFHGYLGSIGESYLRRKHLLPYPEAHGRRQRDVAEFYVHGRPLRTLAVHLQRFYQHHFWLVVLVVQSRHLPPPHSPLDQSLLRRLWIPHSVRKRHPPGASVVLLAADFPRFQYSIFLMWYALAVLLIMTPYLKLEFEYQLDRHWFKEPSELLEKPIDHARHVVSFIYIIVILKYFCSVGTLIRS
ncbi:hypothetical protein L596_014390 [Steinernema carpocapsae]|uniref:Uncharacterized protein n=1 Tax=Steinernema carpocapsae TaxID=34508 RepID=A0A4U5NBS7_STECR|nr:hypothetical protein L596_014390 [Steinernema carpocapsae]